MLDFRSVPKTKILYMTIQCKFLPSVNEDTSQNMYFFYKKTMILQEKNYRCAIALAKIILKIYFFL